MKKVASLVGAGALLFGMVGSAFALDFHHFFGSDTRVRNYARVTNDVDVDADSGDNEIGGKFVFGGRIRTGEATAVGDVFNDVNYTELGCGCDGDLSIRNRARVRNEVDVDADSGDNEVHGMFVHGGSIHTGGAMAGSLVTNLVNTTIMGGEAEE